MSPKQNSALCRFELHTYTKTKIIFKKGAFFAFLQNTTQNNDQRMLWATWEAISQGEMNLSGHVGRRSIVQGLAARLLGKKCLQNPQMNPPTDGALLFRALQHVKECVQPTTVYLWAPFLHLHLRCHITLWCTQTLGYPAASEWSWHPCWVTLETSLWKTPARGWFINRHAPKQAPTFTVQLTGLPGSSRNYREGQNNLIWVRGVFGGQPLK